MPTRPDQHEARLGIIREILEAQAVRSQADLAAQLEARGFKVSQSSVSRDLTELGVARIAGRYVPADSLPGAAPPTDGLAEAAFAIQGLQAAGPHLLVVRTPPGRASVVSVALDEARWREVVGTIAGDDTVFIATAGRRQQDKVRARLARLITESRNG